MTTDRDHLSKSDTVTVAAIEARATMLVEARDLVDRFQSMIRMKAASEGPIDTQAAAHLFVTLWIGFFEARIARIVLTKKHQIVWHRITCRTRRVGNPLEIGCDVIKSLRRIFVVCAVALSATGCVSNVLEVDQKASQPIPAKLVSEMRSRSMSPADPIVVRIFKQESELEIWKRDQTGRYALLKTYPMCRWSGKLGPKTASGDRQAPEGFYHVNAGMLNPKSQYYLSFNLGYPNRLEAALGYTGEALMVHGACSSSGCYALTDEGVAEIFAVARDALRGGQRVFQVQAYPFRMTPQNMAKNRNDPNYAFWRNLKVGHDLFEVTKQPPQVGYCGRSYAFAADGTQDMPSDPLAACPPALVAENSLVADRQQEDERMIEQLVSSGTAMRAHAYSDGGMHPLFRNLLERRGPQGLAKTTSLSSVPVSRPDAALADPHDPKAER